jgi:hypothetical protein
MASSNSVGKSEVPLVFANHHAIKTCGVVVEVQLHFLSILALDES